MIHNTFSILAFCVDLRSVKIAKTTRDEHSSSSNDNNNNNAEPKAGEPKKKKMQKSQMLLDGIIRVVICKDPEYLL